MGWQELAIGWAAIVFCFGVGCFGMCIELLVLSIATGLMWFGITLLSLLGARI